MVDDWSRTWLADPRCQNWFSARIDTDPLGEGESLADYVRDRAEELVALPVDAAMIKGAVDGTGEREDYSKYQDLFDIDSYPLADPSTGTDAFASDFYSYSPSTSQLPDHSFQPRSTESLFVQNPLAQPNMFALFNQRLPDLPTAVNPGLLFPNGSLDPTQISQNSNQASSVAGPSRSRSLAPVTAADGIPSSSLSSLDPTPTSTSNGKTPRSRATSAGNGESKVSALETQWNEAHAQWEQSLSLLNQKNALSPKRFAAAPSATYNAIANLLDTFSITSTGANKRLSRWGDSSDVPPSGRLSILTSMLANARGEFWLAWLEPEKSKNPSKGMEILEKWLLSAVSTKATTAGSTENQLASTVFPILKVRVSSTSRSSHRYCASSTPRRLNRRRRELSKMSMRSILYLFARNQCAISRENTVVGWNCERAPFSPDIDFSVSHRLKTGLTCDPLSSRVGPGQPSSQIRASRSDKTRQSGQETR